MGNFTSDKSLFRLIIICFCSLSVFNALGAVIVYQHNFNNLSSTPLSTELSNAQTSATGLTSKWENNNAYSGFIARADGNGGKALGIGGVPSGKLTLIVGKCRVLDITSISFRIKSPGTGNNVRLVVNGSSYGTTVNLSGDQFAEISKNMALNDLTDQVSISVIVNYGNYTDIVAIDDFTIYGEVTDQIFNPASLIFPPADAPTVRCPFDYSFSHEVIINADYKSLSYSYDDASRHAGVVFKDYLPNNSSINLSFPLNFSGETTVTATLTACNNDVITKEYKVVTKPGGVPDSDMDFQASFTSPYDEDNIICPTGTCGQIKNGCYQAGTIGYAGFQGKTLDVRLRHKNNVRYFEIVGKANVCQENYEEGQPYYWAGFSLYFNQSDFDNYVGALKLPKDMNDEQGKKNLRLLIVSDNIRDQYHTKLVPVTAYKTSGYWVVSYSVGYTECWVANAITSVYLADAGTALPVRLESISAQSASEGNRIVWKTSEEINFSHFELENSEDPRQGFHYLAKILSSKNSLGGDYHYTHIPSSSSQQYYRLKMVDFDSTFEYSKIVTVSRQIKSGDILVYPNPAQNFIFLESPDMLKSVQLIDQKGNKVLSRSFPDQANSFSLPLPKLNAGAYYLKVNSGFENQRIKKVLIN